MSVLEEVDALLAPHLLEPGVGDGQASKLSRDAAGVRSKPAWRRLDLGTSRVDSIRRWRHPVTRRRGQGRLVVARRRW